MKANPIYVGKVVMVFDSFAWRKNGGDSKTDTFMREAKILSIQDDDGEITVDVLFTHNGRISAGHFADFLEECIKKNS